MQNVDHSSFNLCLGNAERTIHRSSAVRAQLSLFFKFSSSFSNFQVEPKKKGLA